MPMDRSRTFASTPSRQHGIWLSLGVIGAILATAGTAAWADIYQWQFNSGTYSASTTPCVGGVGVSAEPGVVLDHLDLTDAYLQNANLTGASLQTTTLVSAYAPFATLTNASLESANLTGANLSNANLTNAGLHGANLTNVNLTNASVVGADFGEGTGFTLQQLSGTASYQAQNLRGIGLESIDLTGANLAGFDLSNASMPFANLTNANLSNANLTNIQLGLAILTNINLSNATITGGDFSQPYGTPTGLTLQQLYSSANYKSKDLHGIDFENNNLAGANLAGQDLTNSGMYGTLLSGADLTNAMIVGADFDAAPFNQGGLSAQQLASTASYQSKDLQGVGLGGNLLLGVNLAGQNLTNANLVSTVLINANLNNADLTNAALDNANLTNASLASANLANAFLQNAILTNADIRGATTSFTSGTPLSQANEILSDGAIDGLHLMTSPSPFLPAPLLTVHNYHASPSDNYAGAIHVSTEMILDPGTELQMIFDGPTWNSTISFDAGIPIAITGSDLELDPSVNPSSLVGVPIQLFDWTGVSPNGQFTVTTNLDGSQYQWNLSDLYTSGFVTLESVPEPAQAALAGVSILGLLHHRPRRVGIGDSLRM
jgi:uncharacterized protein YjbI with pentapeptide repeats